MKRKMQRVGLLYFALVFALSACGGGNVEPTPTPTPEPITISGSGPDSLDLDDPDVYEEIPGDYFIRVEFTFSGIAEDGTEVSGQLMIDGANTAKPKNLSITMTLSGSADLDGLGTMRYVEIDDSLYFVTEELGCMAVPAVQDSPFNDFVDTGGFLTGMANRAMPDEIVNGVDSYHFSLGQENLDTSAPAAMEVREITGGDLYIAKDGGYVVRFVIEGRGISEILSGDESIEGDIFYQLDLEPSQNVEISLPGNCEEAGTGGTDFPVLDDASNVASFEGFYSYLTSYDFETVLDFYKTELVADRWALDNEISAGSMVALLFKMGDRNLNVAIAADPNNEGTLSVVIAEEL